MLQQTGLVLIAIIVLASTFAQAQEEASRPIITAENADQLTVIETLGRGRVTDAGWTADGETLVVASATGLWLYNAADLSAEPRFLPSEHGWIRSAAINSWGGVATGHEDGTVVTWNIDEGRVYSELHGHNKPVVSLAYNGEWLVSFSEGEWEQNEVGEYVQTLDQVIRIWVYYGDLARTIIPSPMDTYYLPFGFEKVSLSPDGTLIALGGIERSWDASSSTLLIYDLDTGATIYFSDYLGDRIYFNPNNESIVSICLDVIDRATWNFIVRSDFEYCANDAAFNVDGTWLATAHYYPEESEIITIWNTADWQPLATFGGHMEATQIAFHPDGNQLATVHFDDTIRIWDIEQEREIAVINDFWGTVDDLEFSANGQLLAAARWNTGLWIWNIADNTLLTDLRHPSINAVAFSPDNQQLAYSHFSYHYGTTIRLLDLATLQSQTIYGSEENIVNTDSELSFYGRASLQEGLTFSPDGAYLAWGDASLHVWDVENELPIWESRQINYGIDFLDFDPSGTQIIANGNDTIFLWDALTGERLNVLETSGCCMALNLSPDSAFVVGSSFHGMGDTAKILVWGTKTYQLAFQQEDEGWHSELGWHFPDVTFSPDSRLLAYSDMDGLIHLLEVGSWNEIAVLDGQYGTPRSLAFTPDGTMLAAGYESGVILLWGIEEE